VRVLFCHGLEGSPLGTKVRTMRAAGVDVLAPDFQGQVLAQRWTTLNTVLQGIPANTPLLLAGSSYGGALAAWAAMHHPGRFSGLLLLAPALHHAEPPVPSPDAYRPVPLPTIIIHGIHDDIVPIEASERYAALAAHVHLRRTDDGHRLANSLDTMLVAIRELSA